MGGEHETLRKRLLLRSWRRGTREMDLLLGRFADHALRHWDARRLADYARLLEENDPDIYDWVAGRGHPKDEGYRSIIGEISRFHGLSGEGGT